MGGLRLKLLEKEKIDTDQALRGALQLLPRYQMSDSWSFIQFKKG